MTLIILVRHGQSQTNVQGILSDSYERYPLSENGVIQAQTVAKELAQKLKVSKLYSSPVFRARQTADIIGKAVGKEVILDSRLKERGWGLMEGKSAMLGAWRFNMSKAEAETVETWDSIKRRVNEFADDAAKDGGVVVGVSHVDTIAALAVRGFGIKDGELSIYALVSPFAAISVFGFDGDFKVIATGLPIIPDSVLEMAKPYMD
jgi:probable phosphoglycerate mutase